MPVRVDAVVSMKGNMKDESKFTDIEISVLEELRAHGEISMFR